MSARKETVKRAAHPIGIGSIVFVRNENRRVYKQENGRSVGGPTEIGHWQEETISDETPRLWVTAHGTKVPKSGFIPAHIAINESSKRTAIWMRGAEYKILQALNKLLRWPNISDAEAIKKTRQVAEILGVPGPSDEVKP